VSFFYAADVGGQDNLLSRGGCFSGGHYEKITCIVQRAGWYHLRVRLPAGLKSLAGRREVRQTLATADYREALRRGLPLLDRLENLFREMRAPMILAPPAALPAGPPGALPGQILPSPRHLRLCNGPGRHVRPARPDSRRRAAGTRSRRAAGT
jgi:hypothetical protein